MKKYRRPLSAKSRITAISDKHRAIANQPKIISRASLLFIPDQKNTAGNVNPPILVPHTFETEIENTINHQAPK
ncbi:hypothetical protein [Kluyvera huaxiensis]|uniref:hypothetical protein n=1 Tax=Kluyvera sp. 142053 TaxID=3160979 RepID=UPI0032DFEAE7